MKKILTIAGSDCSGGAGIQADIKTITMHGMYAMSAITALTAQNTTGVYGIMNSSADFLKNQRFFPPLCKNFWKSLAVSRRVGYNHENNCQRAKERYHEPD